MNKKLYEEEGRNLERLFEKHGIQNRAKFARDHEIKGGGNFIHQHIKGIRPIGLEAGIAYAKAFGIPLSEISSRLSLIIESAIISVEYQEKNHSSKDSNKIDWPFSITYEQYLEIEDPIKTYLDGQLAFFNSNIKNAYEEHKKKLIKKRTKKDNYQNKQNH